MTCRAFTTPKAGQCEDENEDRWGEIRLGDKLGEVASVALSDGATESVFSREWAGAMVGTAWTRLTRASIASSDGFVEPESVAVWLDEARAAFVPAATERPLPWYARQKLSRQGAFATFLGVRIIESGHLGQWTAVGCGDTCFFHVAAGRIATSFPLERSEEFGARPALVPSNAAIGQPGIKCRIGERWTPGDQFVLATDALARWLLDDLGDGRIAALLECRDHGGFTDLVERERSARRMNNDDTTAIIIATW